MELGGAGIEAAAVRGQGGTGGRKRALQPGVEATCLPITGSRNWTLIALDHALRWACLRRALTLICRFIITSRTHLALRITTMMVISCEPSRACTVTCCLLFTARQVGDVYKSVDARVVRAFWLCTARQLRRSWTASALSFLGRYADASTSNTSAISRIQLQGCSRRQSD